MCDISLATWIVPCGDFIYFYNKNVYMGEV